MLKVFVLLLTMSFADVSAQEETPTEKEPERQQSNAEEKKQPRQETPDTFDPTEKLSEDFSVDFPVDI